MPVWASAGSDKKVCFNVYINFVILSAALSVCLSQHRTRVEETVTVKAPEMTETVKISSTVAEHPVLAKASF